MQRSIDYLSHKIRWQERQSEFLEQFRSGSTSFIPGLLPELAVQLPGREVLTLLEERYGKKELEAALSPQHSIASPLADQKDTAWIQQTNMVGINVRTIQNFFNVLKYCLTIPKEQDSIHLLPIWEPGVVASLYGMASWQINSEFFSQEWFEICPHLDTPGKQLKALINLLHLMEKAVGMDVIPHTDRYSEIVLANPSHFEWMRRVGSKIVDHRANLHEEVEAAIREFRNIKDSDFFATDYPESRRVEQLFGKPEDLNGRQHWRTALMQYLFGKGLEPVPATMAPPYRGLEVDPDTHFKDGDGRVWYEYRMQQPEAQSRVFGPLTRFKLFERLDDNKDWQIDFDKPRIEVWDYVKAHYKDIQQYYGFDFMRGDMSHVQMRPNGVPATRPEYYDLHQSIREDIRTSTPHFAYFAETFLAPENTMAYGNELDHLELSDADSTLGDLQSMVPGSPVFNQSFRWYLDLAQARQFKPNFTIMTADKDDPRFDTFYLHGNEARFFTSLFLTDLPSYMGLGFESRDLHPEPAPNEHYTKLYVFQISEGPKATHGPYIWGKNAALFERINEIRKIASKVLPLIEKQFCRWLLAPDPLGFESRIAWTQKEEPRFVFIAHFGDKQPSSNFKLPLRGLEEVELLPFFSTHSPQDSPVKHNGSHFPIPTLEVGECRIYSINSSL